MSPLWAVGLLCAAVLAAFGLWGVLRMWRRPRVRASDAGHWSDVAGDPTHERIDQALDIVSERDQAKARHTDQAMRRLTEDSNE